jgi:hypothetical protein
VRFDYREGSRRSAVDMPSIKFEETCGLTDRKKSVAAGRTKFMTLPKKALHRYRKCFLIAHTSLSNGCLIYLFAVYFMTPF